MRNAIIVMVIGFLFMCLGIGIVIGGVMEEVRQDQVAAATTQVRTCGEWELIGDTPRCVEEFEPTADAVFCSWHDADNGEQYRFCTSWPRSK